MKKQLPKSQSLKKDNKYLEPNDWHLWSKVSATISPLKRRNSNNHLPNNHQPKNNEKLTDNLPKKVRRQFYAPPYIANTQAQKTPNIIEPNLAKRVIRGRLAIDGTIDLHGMNQEEAHFALCRFINARSKRGDKTLLVITGKGYDKTPIKDFDEYAPQHGVLRAMLPHWLSSAPLKTMVSGWQIAARKHGGEGAFYVRLRGNIK